MRGRGHCAQLRGVCFWRSNHALVGFSALLRESRGVSLLVFWPFPSRVLQAANITPPPLRGWVCILFAAAAALVFCITFFIIFAAGYEALVCRSLCQFQSARFATAILSARFCSLGRVQAPTNSPTTSQEAAATASHGRPLLPIE